MEIHHILYPVESLEPPLHTSKYPQTEFDIEKFEKISGIYAITGGAGILGKKENQIYFSSPMGTFNLHYHTNEKFSLSMNVEGAPAFLLQEDPPNPFDKEWFLLFYFEKETTTFFEFVKNSWQTNTLYQMSSMFIFFFCLDKKGKNLYPFIIKSL